MKTRSHSCSKQVKYLVLILGRKCAHPCSKQVEYLELAACWMMAGIQKIFVRLLKYFLVHSTQLRPASTALMETQKKKCQKFWSLRLRRGLCSNCPRPLVGQWQKIGGPPLRPLLTCFQADFLALRQKQRQIQKTSCLKRKYKFKGALEQWRFN